MANLRRGETLGHRRGENIRNPVRILLAALLQWVSTVARKPAYGWAFPRPLDSFAAQDARWWLTSQSTIHIGESCHQG